MSFDPSKYGLKVVDGPGGDGTFKADDGKYYQAIGFERNQKEGLDEDKGQVFGSSLKQDSGINVTSFNTINDVKQAVNAMVGSGKTSRFDESKPVELSPRLAEAQANIAAMDEIGGHSRFLLQSKDEIPTGSNAGQSFLDRYKIKLGERLATGYYVQPDESKTNSSRVATGMNDVSLDAAEYSRTGLDNRYGY